MIDENFPKLECTALLFDKSEKLFKIFKSFQRNRNKMCKTQILISLEFNFEYSLRVRQKEKGFPSLLNFYLQSNTNLLKRYCQNILLNKIMIIKEKSKHNNYWTANYLAINFYCEIQKKKAIVKFCEILKH